MADTIIDNKSEVDNDLAFDNDYFKSRLFNIKREVKQSIKNGEAPSKMRIALEFSTRLGEGYEVSVFGGLEGEYSIKIIHPEKENNEFFKLLID